MKKNLIIAITTVVLSGATIFGLCSFKSNETTNNQVDNIINTHACGEGKYCNYSVGCGCPGFAPIQHKEVYKLSICKHCGHHRSFHKF